MAKLFGFAGKILKIDLTHSKASEIPTSNYVPQYIGGRGIATRIYWEEVDPKVKALDPENRLIFITGPIQGTLSPHSGRIVAVTKSPFTYPTESIADSCAGGFFAPELKFAGYDGIVIFGKSPRPVYLWIKDGEARILDAKSLWGQTTFNTQRELWNRHGWESRIVTIGPAGENLCRIATMLTDSGSSFGQGGFGAVMGSKNLKAIVVRGTGSVEVAKPDELLKIRLRMNQLAGPKTGETAKGFKGKMFGQNARRGLGCLYNLSASEIGELARLGKVKTYSVSCYQCPIGCKTGVQFLDGSFPSGADQCDEASDHSRLDADFYKTNPGTVSNYEWTKMVQELGLNVYEVPDGRSNASFGANLVKDGILTEANTGWPMSKFGSADFFRQVLPDIAYRRGFGEIWSGGNNRVADFIAGNIAFGKNRNKAVPYLQLAYPKAGKFAGWQNHHNILPSQLQYSTALYWAVANRDAQNKHTDWCFYDQRGLVTKPSTESKESLEMLGKFMKKWIGTDKPVAPPGYEDAEVAARWWQQHYWEIDCLILCDWMRNYGGGMWSQYTEDGIGDIEEGSKELNAVTGWDLTQKQLWAEAERPWILERAIACREGRRKGDDLYNKTWITESRSSVDKKGRRFDMKKYEEALGKFYKLIGWDENGVPTQARLKELGLEDVAKKMKG